ncbi:MAG: YihY/virulence factor BrkB family protein [Acidobacteriales bacterium]|nr:YihY/virulence factor BrkB family protein [Terriglobales bacterium]
MAESVLSTKQQLKSLWALGGLSPRQLTKCVWQGIDQDDLVNRASELAYNFLLALFPLILFLLSFFGLFASRATELQNDLLFSLARVLPPAAFQLLRTTIDEVTKSNGGGRLTFSIVIVLWLASGGMSSMISTLNGAYGVREGRSWIKVRAISLGLTLSISILVISALALTLISGHVVDFVGSRLGLGALPVVAWKLLQWPLALFFIVSCFSMVYFYGPDLKEQHWYWITPGSVVGVLLWIVASFAIRAYLHFFNTYSKTYGSLGAVIILLLWLYVTGFAFLIGGEINAKIEHAAAKHGHPEAKEAGQKAA